jgi:hypothetical protein
MSSTSSLATTYSSTFRVGPPKLEELPEALRTKYLTFKESKSKPHPLYATASGDIGKVPRGLEVALVPPVAAKQGGFSKTFTAGGAVRSQSLITAMAKNRFHSALD